MMLTITVYNQSGGQTKSSVTRDLAAAFAEIGDDVLVVDFDAQNSSVSNYFGVDDDKSNPDADTLTRHLIDQGQGPFEDITETYNEHIDVIPSHKQFGDVGDRLDEHEEYLKGVKPDDWEYPRYERFLDLVKKHDLQDDYDVMLVDPNAKADEAWYLALYATRNVLIPAEATRGGVGSIDGVNDSMENFAEAMGISVSAIGVVPAKVDATKEQHVKHSQTMNDDFVCPIYTKSLSAFEKAEDNYQTVFELLKNKRIRNSEQDIMPKFRTLAAHVYSQAGQELPNGGWDEDELWHGNEFWGDVDDSTFASVLSSKPVVEAE
jgi:cellulose biosynthesis protein BcsQ